MAEDPESRSLGLMFRKCLGKNSGMLFSFPHEDYYSFWMQNTYIPLDIAFIDKSGTVVDIRQMMPLSTRNVRPDFPCKYALEVNRDWFSENGVEVGYSFKKDVVTSAYRRDIQLIRDFRSAVYFSAKNGLNMLVTYQFRDESYRDGKAYKKDMSKPLLKDYELILDGSVKLPSGQVFEYADKGNGRYIIAPCKTSSGEPRQFFIDGVLDYRFISAEGIMTAPEAIDFVEKKTMQYDKLRERNRKRRDVYKQKREEQTPEIGENPALEGIESIEF